jgi:hypothetical protein
MFVELDLFHISANILAIVTIGSLWIPIVEGTNSMMKSFGILQNLL